jgi:plasmid stabilization system protein ParE
VHYRVELQPAAELDIERQYRRLEKLVRRGEVRPGYPEEWYEAVEEALYSLAEFPERCPPAPEAERFRRPFKHLVLPNAYRIIFEVRAENNTVWVLHVRHQRQNPLGAPR